MNLPRLLIVSSFFFAVTFSVPAQDVLGCMNPVLRKHAENITFYLNFDEDNQLPAMAQGPGNVKLQQGAAIFKKGLFGKSMHTGQANYYAEGNLDMSGSGTLILWLSPWQWKQTGSEAYILPFVAFTDTSKLLFGRQGGAWGKTCIYTHVTVPGGKNNIYLGVNGGSAKDWKNGEWHMLVLVWTSATIGISVDGSKLTEKNIPQPLGRKTEYFYINADVAAQILVDEIMILNKKLNDDEIKSIYDKISKVTGK
jgi:hypothetical protein